MSHSLTGPGFWMRENVSAGLIGNPRQRHPPLTPHGRLSLPDAERFGLAAARRSGVSKT